VESTSGKEKGKMSVRKKLIKPIVFTVLTIIIGISSIIGADKRHGITH